MATLSYADIAKRDNRSILLKRVAEGGFQLTDDKGPSLKCTGKMKVKFAGNVKTYTSKSPMSVAELDMFLAKKKGTDYIDIEVKSGSILKMVRVTNIFKDKEFGGVASKASGAGSERQEIGLIQAINQAVNENSNVKLPQLSRTQTLVGARKNEGLSAINQEPYIDVFIETSSNTYGVSCKGTTAPSLAGGGAGGLQIVVPDLVRRLYATIISYITDDLKLSDGDVVNADLIPDLFIQIPDEYVEDILKGNERMGGPIDFMYVGPMDVTSKLNYNKELKVSGDFFNIQDYMKKIGTFYFRVRKRDLQLDNTTKIELTKKTNIGYPLVLADPIRGKNNLRIVITDKVPSTGKVLSLKL